MAGFVFAHFVYGVVHGVVSEFLSPLCEHELAFGRAPFGFDSQLQILLGVGIYAFSEEFRELCGVFCLFKGYSFVRFRDFRISLSASNSCHRLGGSLQGTFQLPCIRR